MKMTCTRAISGLVLSILATFAAPASATSATLSGTIASIVVQSSDQGDSYVTLATTQSVGQCIKSGGRVMALIPADDRGKAMISMLESALLAGKSVSIFLDDRGATSGTYCFAKSVQLS